ncbi:MAG: type II toxin-antitoxin system PemK/MazF family toxin [Myxococcota bacterium]
MNQRKKRVFRRHEVWWTTIPDKHTERPEFSDGTKKHHPFLIISTNEITKLGLCIGVPGTSHAGEDSQWHYQVSPEMLIVGPGDRGLSIDTHLLFEQMRVVSTKRLVSRAGKLHGVPRVDIEEILRTILCLD